MGFMFSNNYKLKSIDLSNFNTQNIEYIDGMFENCISLTSLNISHFDTKKVEIMYHMFKNCSSLTSLDLSNFNMERVTDINEIFYSCSKLKYLDISSFILTSEPRSGGYDEIFKGLPISGQIIINKNINGDIFNQIPSTWNKTIIE